MTCVSFSSAAPTVASGASRVPLLPSSPSTETKTPVQSEGSDSPEPSPLGMQPAGGPPPWPPFPPWPACPPVPGWHVCGESSQSLRDSRHPCAKNGSVEAERKIHLLFIEGKP